MRDREMRWAVWILAIGSVIGLAGGNAVAADNAIEFNIEVQELGQALNEFALQSGREILFSEADTANKKSAAVKGRYAAMDALRILLQTSGLTYTVNELNTVLVGSMSRAQSGASATEPARFPDPAASGAQEDSAPGSNRASSAVGKLTGFILGRVADASSGSDLRGALVRLQETGETTETDEFGRFRFRSVAPGSHTLVVSYLGFADTVMSVTSMPDNPEARVQVALDRSAEYLAEVTVFGTRSARGAALNQQRSAENSSFVISADALGNFSGTTVAEALRRAPGVAFERDSVNGDGTNIILRGLEPKMNAIELNGQQLPGLISTMGFGSARAPTINNLLADAVDTITIHHSLLPSMSSMGSGGLVEIETKSPLRRPGRFAQFGAEYGRAGGDFSDDLLATGTVSGIFGEAQDFGISASVQYRERQVQTIAYWSLLNFGQYLPANITSLNELDPRIAFPFEPGVDEVYPNSSFSNFNDSESETLDATVSADWRIGEHSELRLDIQRARTRSETFSRTASNSFTSFLNYWPTPVAALGGEERYALSWDSPYLPEFANRQALVGQSYQRQVSDDTTESYSLRGDSSAGRWQHRYSLGYSVAKSAPDGWSIGSQFRSADAGIGLDPAFFSPALYNSEGLAPSAYARRTGLGVPLPMLTDAGWDYFNDPESYTLENGFHNQFAGDNSRYAAELTSRYAFADSHLQYLEAGVNFDSAEFSGHNETSFAYLTGADCPPEELFCSASPADFGLEFDVTNLAPIGVRDRGFRLISQRDIEQFINGLPALDAVSDQVQIFPAIVDESLLNNSTREETLAAYLQGSLKFGKLEIVGGARFNRVDVEAVNLYSPEFIREDGEPDLEFSLANRQVIRETGVTTDVLPRVQVNYRKNDNLIFRGSYNLAVARPDIAQLSSRPSLSLNLQPAGPSGEPLLQIARGNPRLEPAVTHSFELGVEHYSADIGLIRFNAFYKSIDNLLDQNTTQYGQVSEIPTEVALPDDPDFQTGLASPNLLIFDSVPVNSPYQARIWGLETHVEKQFVSLPGLWNGLGLFANLTFIDSARVQLAEWSGNPDPDGPRSFYVRGIAFDQQPKFSGTFAVTYNARGIDASISYSGQSSKGNQYFANGLVIADEMYDSVDFRVACTPQAWGSKYRIYLEGSDLLRGTHDPDLLQKQAGYYTTASFLGGRRLKLGFNATF